MILGEHVQITKDDVIDGEINVVPGTK
jgi:hypothetical protein